MAANRQYFPAVDMADLTATQQQGIAVADRAQHFGTEGVELFTRMANLMLAFRQFHGGAVNKHLGADAVGSAEGDGAHAMLQRRRDSYASVLHNATQRLMPKP